MQSNSKIKNKIELICEVIELQTYKNGVTSVHVESEGIGRPYVTFFNNNAERIEKYINKIVKIAGYLKSEEYRGVWSYRIIGESYTVLNEQIREGETSNTWLAP